MHLISSILSSCAIILSVFNLFKLGQFQESNVKIERNQQVLTKLLLNRAKSCVFNDKEIVQKEAVCNLIDQLDSLGSVVESGPDDLRVKYVTTQGSIEHVLACAMVLGEINHLVGVIHTPMPATPLCTKVDHLDQELLDQSIRYDLEKLLTVRSRAVVVREYLEQGGKLFIAYPKGGLEKRTQQQQQVYKQELEKYAGRLFDVVLSCIDMEPSKVGATYLFTDVKGDVYVFSIKANQASAPQNLSEWGLWLGKLEDHAISERVLEIINYLVTNDGPNVLETVASQSVSKM